MKFLKIIFAMIMLLALLTACQQQIPTTYTLAHTEALAKPVVTGSYIAGSGIIRLTWGKVNGAAVYDIYKQSPTTSDKKVQYEMVGNTANLYFFDIISTNNILAAGSTYNFIVVARAAGQPDDAAVNLESNTVVSVAIKSTDVVPAIGTEITAPTNVTLTNAGDRIYVSWTASNYAVLYNVYTKTGNSTYITELIKDGGIGGPGTLEDGTKTNTLYSAVGVPGAGITTVTIVPVAPSDWFVVKQNYGYAQVTIDASLPSPTTNSISTTFTDRIELNFNRVTVDTLGNTLTTAATYDIWRCENNTNNYTKLSITPVEGNTQGVLIATDTTATAGITYDYLIVAKSGTMVSDAVALADGKKALAADPVYTIATPTGVAVYDPAGNYPYTAEIQIEWSKVTNWYDVATGTVNVDASSYDIYRTDDGTNYVFVANTAGTQSESDAGKLYYIDNSAALEQGKNYRYKVRAVNATKDLHSTLSAASGNLRIAGLASITNFSASKDNNNNVTFTWTGMKNIASYQIYYSTKSAIYAITSIPQVFDYDIGGDGNNTLGSIGAITGDKDGYFDDNVLFNGLPANGTYDDGTNPTAQDQYVFWIIAIAVNGERSVSNKVNLTR